MADDAELQNKLAVLKTTLEETNTKLDTLDVSINQVDTDINTLGTKLDTVNIRIGDPSDPGTKGSLLEAIGDENTAHTVINELEDLDVTMEAVNTNVTILDTTLQETNTRIGDPSAAGTKDSLLKAFGDESTEHTVIKELEDVDSTLGTTNTKLDTLNTRVGDPAEAGTKGSLLEALGDESTQHTVIKELEDVDVSLGTLDTSVNDVDATLGSTNTKLDTLADRVGDPADPNTKSSLLEAIGDENTAHTVINELEDLDTTMQAVDGNIQVLDTSINTVDGTLTGTIDPSLSELDTSVNNLKTSVDTLSERYIKSEHSALSVQHQSGRYSAENVITWAKEMVNGDDEAFGVGAALAYDSTNETFYCFTSWDGGNENALVSFTEESKTLTNVATNIWANQVPIAGTFDDSTGKLWVIDPSDGLTLTELNLDTGAKDTTVTPSSTAGNTISQVWGITYNSNDGTMVVCYQDNGNGVVGIINLSTGDITEEQTLGGGLYGRMFFQRGLVWMENNAEFRAMTPYNWQQAYDTIDDPVSGGGISRWGNGLTSNPENFKIYTTYGCLLYIGAIVSLQHIEGISGTISLPTGASTSAKQDTMITALQKIDDLQDALTSVDTDEVRTREANATNRANSNISVGDTATQIVAARTDRRGILIQNDDDADSVWIGDGSVTISNGVRLYPKQSMPINDFGGQLHGICDTGKTADVRYLEVW